MRIGWMMVTMLAAGSAAMAATNDALSRKAIQARIREHRTADLEVTVVDAGGEPVPGAKVTVRQVRHAFLFGANAFPLKPGDASEKQRAYQARFTDLLNFATLAFYWGSFERQPGRLATEDRRARAAWLLERGIRTKGHPLLWNMVPPRWLPEDLEELERLQMGRITREVAACKGQIDTWDVVNEMVRMPDDKQHVNPITHLAKKLGRVETVKRAFARARAAHPKATLLINDFRVDAAYERLIEACLEAGVTIDAIGLQSHMHRGAWPSEKAWEVCERFKRFGKPLHFTEVTIISGRLRDDMRWEGRHEDWPTTPEGEARQAQEVRDFYTVLFSHPAVEAITWWDLVDGHWLGAPAGLLRRDMSAKPAYAELRKMIKGEWWTDETVETGEDGRVTVRGFRGEYEVAAPGAKPVMVRIEKGGAKATVKQQE